jgi:hypothetical protein
MSFYNRLSKSTIFIGIFIIISASFARQAMNFFKAYAGEKGFVILVGIILLLSGIVFLSFVFRRISNGIKAGVFVLVVIGGLIFAWQIAIPEEKIHVLEYGMLGWLATRDLMRLRFFRGVEKEKICSRINPERSPEFACPERSRRIEGRSRRVIDSKFTRLFAACVFCITVGILDEVFQGILPYRYFQWSDIMLNSLGGIWGVILCLLSL